MTSVRVLRWGAGCVIVTIAVLRVCAIFVPQLVFDVDPALDPSPLGGFGPAGSLTLDALLLVACAAGLYGETLANHRVDWRLLALALIPVPVIAWHGASDFGDLWRGATWIAAAAGAVTMAHLGRDRVMRPFLVALLVAVLVPVLLRGLSQSGFSLGSIQIAGPEHATTVHEFERQRDAFFTDRGWTADSPAARIYERRLRSPDPRGWFPTSNIFASLMAFGVVFSLGVATEGALRRRGRGWVVGFGAASVVALIGLLLAGSKGALGATLIGAAVVGAAAWLALHPDWRPSPRVAGAVVLSLVVCVLLAVVARGTLVPEGFMGEKSLLFRWHYMVGASRIVAENRLHGVGPDGFQAAYVGVRSPRSPEEVTSAHSMIADWLAMVGVFGAAWAGIVGMCLWRAGASLVAPPQDREQPAMTSPRAPLVFAAAVAMLGLLPALAAEFHRLGDLTFEGLRLLGILGFVVVGAALTALLAARPSGFADRALAAGALVLVVHGQIEMTFFDPGSCVWVMAVVGLAGVVPGELPRRHWLGVGGAAALLLTAIWLGTICAPRAFAAERWAIEAARVIGQAPESRQAAYEARRTAAQLLEAAWANHPAQTPLGNDAARQWLTAASLAPESDRRELTDRAIGLAERAAATGSPTSIALAADAWRERATRTNAPRDWDAAIAHARHLTELDPHGIGGWVRLGDLLWDARRHDEAASAYERALAASDNFDLDPLKQLGVHERDRLEARVSNEL